MASRMFSKAWVMRISSLVESWRLAGSWPRSATAPGRLLVAQASVVRGMSIL
jgi:hypothetical protein